MRLRRISLIAVTLGMLGCQITPGNDGVNLGVEIIQATQSDEEPGGISVEVTFSTTTPEPQPTRAIPNPNRSTTEEYSTVDRPDDVAGYQIHFVYALPSDGEDELLDVDGSIALSAQALNSWLEGKTGSRLRYDSYQGDLDISFMQLEYTAEQISDLGTHILLLMEYEIKTRGFDTSNKLYVIYYDGFFVTNEGYCGLAAFPPEGAGVTATLLLRGYSPRNDLVCPRQFTQSADYTGYFEMTILHELLHLTGMVPECAPHYQDGHVSDNSQDLLFHQYDGSYSPLYTYLDYRNDDYFGHGDPDCPDFGRSVFLDPEPANAELPPRWEVSSTFIPNNPLEE
ncbi:MAG: hypothetical protein ACRDFQ_00140 [Anaerolineales bacterium]